MWVEPVTLEGRLVTLEPISEDHAEGLWRAAAYPGIWSWMPVWVETEEQFRGLFSAALENLAKGTSLPFVTRIAETGEIVGSTSYLNIDPENRRLEVGYTWITPAWQRTGVNTEAKYLQMTHAFETLGANRVEFKTDSKNDASRKALARIGAVEEGVLRRHMIRHDGSLRDSVYFSVLASEWPRVRALLEALMAEGAGGE